MPPFFENILFNRTILCSFILIAIYLNSTVISSLYAYHFLDTFTVVVMNNQSTGPCSMGTNVIK